MAIELFQGKEKTNLPYTPLTPEQRKDIQDAADKLLELYTSSKDTNVKSSAYILYNSCLYRLQFDSDWKIIKAHLYPKSIQDGIIEEARNELLSTTKLGTISEVSTDGIFQS